ncbi:MAG: hypothetical protein V3T86_06710 [Planctomycetota bacterium]
MESVSAAEVLRAYVRAHNEMIATGSLRPFMRVFAEQAEVRLGNLGPFVGHLKIFRAFGRDRDWEQLRLIDCAEPEPECAVGRIGLSNRAAPEIEFTGTLEIRLQDGLIGSLTLRTP